MTVSLRRKDSEANVAYFARGAQSSLHPVENKDLLAKFVARILDRHRGLVIKFPGAWRPSSMISNPWRVHQVAEKPRGASSSDDARSSS